MTGNDELPRSVGVAFLRWVGCAVFLLSAGALAAAEENASFWVWNRAEPLSHSERTALHDAGVDKLYWQAGELELHGGQLIFHRTAPLPYPDPPLDNADANPQIIPVVRVSTAIHSPELFTGEALGHALRPVVEASSGHEVQLDFDCPDRLLPIYAERLRTARRTADIHRLTITALAGWAGTPAATSLWPAVDAVYPMLYDTQTDPAPAPGDPTPCRPRALLDPQLLAARLQSWRACPIPWYAGLPGFARVTLYGGEGRSRGHLRSWDWEDLIFNPTLVLDRPPAGGTTVLHAIRPTRVGESPMAAGDYLAVRTAERQAIQSGISAAKAAGAHGAVLFRLPDPPSPLRPTGSGWSLPQLLALLAPSGVPTIKAPHLTLRHAQDGSERWVLRNDSGTDLPARFDAPDRGYGLELELAGSAPAWREALPGDFHRVVGHVFSDPEPGKPATAGKSNPVAIPLARRLTFWFAELPAHAELTTGLVQFAPGVDPATLRFRVPVTASPDPSASSTWQTPD